MEGETPRSSAAWVRLLGGRRMGEQQKSSCDEQPWLRGHSQSSIALESEGPPHSGPCHLPNNRPGLRYRGFHSGASRHSRITFLELAFVMKRCPLQCKILLGDENAVDDG
jgi:hypothetical protein